MAAESILLIGAGGIGAPCALALAHAAKRLAGGALGQGGGFELVLADDDKVERSNLHRQILFEPSDVGKDKIDALAAALHRIAPALTIRLHSGRLLPATASQLVDRSSLIIDATDNFATRFLAADAAMLGKRAIVHAASIRWQATVIAVSAVGRPCYRCLFEDLPVSNDAPNCATAGIVGPVCGVAGAIAASLALSALAGDYQRTFGAVFTYDGWRDRLRRVPVAARSDCALCGEQPSVVTIDANRYEQASVCEGF